MNLLNFPGLAIMEAQVAVDDLNFRPGEWPPPLDFPVVIDDNGRVIARLSDSVLVFDKWVGKRCTINFGDGKVSKLSSSIDTANANILRLIVAWWLYGKNGVQSVSSLLIRFANLRPLFSLCSREGILVTELKRYPAIIAKLHTVFMPSTGAAVVSILHNLVENADVIGFELLGTKDIARVAADMPEPESSQSAYIPPRIWNYQANRLRECIEVFLAHRSQFESLYRYCANAYAINYGKEGVKIVGGRAHHRPFKASKSRPSDGRLDFGKFEDVAKRFGVMDVLLNWVGPLDPKKTFKISYFSSYLNLINWASHGYILNFTLMRTHEANDLKRSCFTFDDDARFGRVYLIRGETSKTIKDDDTYWVTSESSKLAIEALQAVSDLRKYCDPQIDDRLLQPPTEPWAGGAVVDNANIRKVPKYKQLWERFPKLFDNNELEIKKRDLELARLATPTLDDRFKIGAIWPLTWHQLRRTGAVNMQASGLISDSSLQFQLKHLARAMSLYYGRNHARVHLESVAHMLYVKTMYEVIGREMQSIASARFLSPHGAKRKEEILKLIDPTDLKAAVELAKNGGVACRNIALGACMNVVPCPYGGIESVAHCGGGDNGKACAEVLYDRSKMKQVKRLERLIEERLKSTPIGSPLYKSLFAQKKSVTNYFFTLHSEGNE